MIILLLFFDAHVDKRLLQRSEYRVLTLRVPEFKENVAQCVLLMCPEFTCLNLILLVWKMVFFVV